MNKKNFLVPIILIIIGAIIPQTTATDIQSIDIFDNFRLIKTNSTTEISVDQTNVPSPSVPVDLNETLYINVNVGLKGELPLLFPELLIGTKIGKWIIFRDENQNSTVNVNLSVTSPIWCTAELEKEIIEVDLFSDSKKSTKLMVTIKETALALQEGQIKIKAEFSPPGNEKWMFKSSENETSFKIISKYSGNIKATIEPLEKVNKFIVKPNVNTTLPLNITNNFNGETKIHLRDLSNCTSPTELVLGKEEVKEIR